ncbi:UNVERIFIED_CONTAM: Autophagy-related protein 13b [Sesamum angustifolium]|uniref:Autophagy-related protein 13b n=1 Tax=Sesamum angustifolium TaxID=2727405 RepID=A0AAW2NHT3_9LAMI
MASSHGNTHSEPAKMEQIITEFFAKSLHIILESRSPYVSSRNNYSGEQVLSSPSPSSSPSSSSFKPRDKWFNLALRDCPAALENIDFWRQSNLEPMIVDVILMQRPNDWDPSSFSPKRGLARNSSGKERYYYGSDNDECGCEAKNEKIIERWVLQYESKKSGGNGGGSSGSKRSSSTSSHALYKKSILLLRSFLVSFISIGCDFGAFNPYITTNHSRICGESHGRTIEKVPSVPVSQSSPSSSPFGRRHSWSYDLYRASPPSVNPSPSPTYSESHASLSKQRSHRLPPAGLPRHLHDETPAAHMKNPSYDDSFAFPYVFTISISITTTTHLCSWWLSSMPSLPNNQLMLPSPPMKGTRLTVSKHAAHPGLHQTSSTVDKLFSFSKDEPGKMLGETINKQLAIKIFF